MSVFDQREEDYYSRVDLPCSAVVEVEERVTGGYPAIRITNTENMVAVKRERGNEKLGPKENGPRGDLHANWWKEEPGSVMQADQVVMLITRQSLDALIEWAMKVRGELYGDH
jgi:hypothetical protein